MPKKSIQIIDKDQAERYYQIVAGSYPRQFIWYEIFCSQEVKTLQYKGEIQRQFLRGLSIMISPVYGSLASVQMVAKLKEQQSSHETRQYLPHKISF